MAFREKSKVDSPKSKAKHRTPNTQAPFQGSQAKARPLLRQADFCPLLLPTAYSHPSINSGICGAAFAETVTTVTIAKFDRLFNNMLTEGRLSTNPVLELWKRQLAAALFEASLLAARFARLARLRESTASCGRPAPSPVAPLTASKLAGTKRGGQVAAPQGLLRPETAKQIRPLLRVSTG